MQEAHLIQIGLLLLESILVAALVLGLYELRRAFGLAVLYVGIGSFQFVQVVASVGLYVEVAPGVLVSPGSAVLFSANVFVVLLLYVYEHIREARQLIYGLVISNLVVAAVTWIFDMHVALGASTQIPRELLARNPRVLAVGTLALYVDVLVAVVLYEALHRRTRLPAWLGLMAALSVALVLDSLMFTVGAFWGHPNFRGMMAAGALGKVSAGVVYSLAFALYSRRRAPNEDEELRLPFGDLFEYLTLARRVEVLMKEGERYELAVRGGNDGLWDWDLRADKVHVTALWSQMMGLDHEGDLAPQRWIARVLPEDQALLQGAIDDHVEGRSDRLEVQYRVEIEGEQRWLVCRGLVATDEHGRPTRMAGSQVDITEQKRAEAAKDEFVSVVSHELRTPVTAIRGAVTLLRSNLAEGRTPELLGMAERNAVRLSELIDDLLDVQRIARGKLEYRFEEHDVGVLVREAVEAHAGYADRTGTRFVVTQVQGDLWVEADAGRIGQVLANFLSNAAKFSPSGSEIDVSARRVDGRVRVEVRDRGAGVPAEFQSQVFEKFTQAESANTRGIAGTGLGLNISRSIITAHGGEIGYEDAPGGGALFYFALPPRQPR